MMPCLKKIGREITLTILRGGLKKEITVTLSPPKE